MLKFSAYHLSIISLFQVVSQFSNFLKPTDDDDDRMRACTPAACCTAGKKHKPKFKGRTLVGEEGGKRGWEGGHSGEWMAMRILWWTRFVCSAAPPPRASLIRSGSSFSSWGEKAEWWRRAICASNFFNFDDAAAAVGWLVARLRPIQIFWISEPDTEPN